MGGFEESQKTIFWTVMVIAITFFIFIFVYALSGYQGKISEVPSQLKTEMIVLRFINIPACFAYQDENTERIHSGIIDLRKFNDEQLAKCYHTEGLGGFKTFNFRLELSSHQEQLISDNYFNLDNDDFTIKKEVLVREGDNLRKEMLTIYVQEGLGKEQ